jgi:hypothetical protein
VQRGRPRFERFGFTQRPPARRPGRGAWMTMATRARSERRNVKRVPLRRTGANLRGRAFTRLITGRRRSAALATARARLAVALQPCESVTFTVAWWSPDAKTRDTDAPLAVPPSEKAQLNPSASAPS